MARIGWKHVESSNLDDVDYDPGDETLYVRFKTGAEYSYWYVPAQVYHGLINADSKGRYFQANIRGHYICVREEDNPVTNS